MAELSLVIINDNAENYLINLFLSLKYQTIKPYWEIIFVDNHSGDTSLKEICQWNIDCTYSFDEKIINKGILYNKGFELSSCENVLFIHSDIFFANDFFEKLYLYINSNPQYDFVNFSQYYADGNLVGINQLGIDFEEKKLFYRQFMDCLPNTIGLWLECSEACFLIKKECLERYSFNNSYINSIFIYELISKIISNENNIQILDDCKFIHYYIELHDVIKTIEMDFKRFIANNRHIFELKEKNNIIQTLNKELQTVGNWGKEELSNMKENYKITQDNCEELQIRIAHLEKIYNMKNKELCKKQTELMEMSDWAYGMMLRLKDMEASPVIMLLEKLNKYPLRLVKKIKAKGFKGIIKSLIRKIIPKYFLNKIKHRKSHIYMHEIISSVINNKGHVIVAFPVIPWSFRWQRPQHILSLFAKNGYTVIYLSLDMLSKGYKYKSLEEAGIDLTYSYLYENIYEVHCFSKNQVNIYKDILHEDDIENLFISLSSLLKQIKITELTYMVQFPGWSNVAFKLKQLFGGKLIFDCMDEHGGFSNNHSEILNIEQKLLKEANLVITSSAKLLEKGKRENNNTILVRNGTEYTHFNNAEINGELDFLGDKPIIGYYGAISEWFDIELIEYCARQRPKWNFVLVGSVVGCNISRVQTYPNVHLLGERSYSSLPGYLAYFDVCTIPFEIIPLTLATNPVKFYEYLSCGKPVVATKLPELELYNEECYLADDKYTFLNMLEKALDEKDDVSLINRRLQLAKNNSWEQRFNTIQKEMEKI